MIAVAPTDLDWYRQLRASSLKDNINFWTPTPWNIKGLSRGDRFYFLLKAPYRKIGGYGVFREYLNLPVSEAWERFGLGNGVESQEELLSRTEKYAEKRSDLDREPTNPTIGCIVLDECKLFDESDLVDPDEIGLDFPPTVVKLK